MSLQSERRFLSKTNLTSGTMVEFSYIAKDSTTKTYSVLVIDVINTNDIQYLHGLLLDNLSDFDIIKLSTQVGNQFNFNPDERDVPLTSLNSDEAYSRYKTSIFKNDRRYRTFILDNVSNLTQILIGEIT